ncbi:PHD finger protein 7-like isoform X2 [Cygnus olor]|uniref:PHD finger protein 7-like isoform X2 n=1 Tax=Cygnus olor TaxID=8869 RepID=UPI001ADEB1D4|nr:PHD finger protein 7-like isoform X2 [Cygnus olor]
MQAQAGRQDWRSHCLLGSEHWGRGGRRGSDVLCLGLGQPWAGDKGLDGGYGRSSRCPGLRVWFLCWGLISSFFPHRVSRGPSGEAPTLLELGFGSVCCQITVSVMKRRAPDMRKKVCVLCNRADEDPDIYGQKSENRGLCTHENCLYLASGLSSNQARSSEVYNILPEDIQRVVKQATRKMCYVCGERGATITCQQKRCKHSFHYP